MLDLLKSRLLEAKQVTEEQFEELVQASREEGETLDQLLCKRGVLEEEAMLALFGELLELPFRAQLDDVEVPDEFVSRVPIKFAKAYHLVGLARTNGTLAVATCRPMDLYTLDELAAMLGLEVEVVLAPRAAIAALINRYYTQKAKEERTAGDYGGLLANAEEDLENLQTSDNILDDIDRAPVIRKVNQLLFNALKMRASDIHFQPYEYKLQVRYRIDGLLYDQEAIPKRVQELILTRLKVMGRMDIAERRMPQDGRATIRVGDAEIDLRISSLPTPDGERVVLRILDKTSRVFALTGIGLSAEQERLVREYIQMPNGIILVTGPTGSGKTTTLYASLTHVNSPEKNIITVEDPIEYQLAGISQVEVNVKKGLTFARGLRTIVRQDPDVIMVGEIRDGETAGIAIQSALTGHLVFSTLHTNDACGAITRLSDLGVEPYLVSSSLILVVAQRLVRKICEHCRESYEPMPTDLAPLGLTAADLSEGRLWRGKGCGKCLELGYQDRTGIYEMLPITETIKTLTVQRGSAAAIKKHASDHEGLISLRQDAIRKLRDGVTTLEEVVRITQRDSL